MRTLSVLSVFAILFLVSCANETKPYTGPALPYTPEPPKPKEPNPTALLSTEHGDIALELFEDDAPNTVASFVELAEKNFFDNLTFHRIIKDFMIQGGDPKGDGSGGPGYRFADEIKNNPNKFDKYALAMANRGKGSSTNGSQFFITTTDNPPPGLFDQQRQPNHTIFGKVTKGQEVVDKIAASPVQGDRANPPVKIKSVKILSKRSHKYEVRNKIIDAPNPPAPPAMPETKVPDASKTPETKAPEKKEEPKPAGEAPKTEAPKPAETK
ncbi:MAG TPA: peptidylprolyl isomerase [Planctomycetota bacterium]|nr:peptidylprolyl isomerase [Planctomycetota bacterium]